MSGRRESILKERDSFSTKFGFVMACIGASVGMGNIWLFPYRVAEFGGAAFLIPYFIFVVILGFTGLIGEMALGRAMGTGPIGAFEKAFKQRGWKGGAIVGFIPTIGSLGIGIGYAVVIGWILKYMFGAITGDFIKEESSGAYFGAIAGNFGSIPWHVIGLVITFIFMIFGISGGIEKMNKVLMPIFFALFVILAVRVSFLEGAAGGYAYLFSPKWSALANPKTWVFALGQAFFSLSLAGSGTLVYGSYLKKDANVIQCATRVAFFDTTAALLSALVIIPAVFAYGLEMGAGPGLLFITMPEVFRDIPFGQIVAIAFFFAVFCAGITSLVNLFETPVEAIQERMGVSRPVAIIIVAIIAFGAGVFIEGDLLSPWMDIVSIYIVPMGALLAALVMFWVCEPWFARDQIQLGIQKRIGGWLEPMTKFVFCGIAIIVYILGLVYGGIG